MTIGRPKKKNLTAHSRRNNKRRKKRDEDERRARAIYDMWRLTKPPKEQNDE